MTEIRRATAADAALIAELGRRTFIEGHPKAATEADIAEYFAKSLTVEKMREELGDPRTIFHLAYQDGILAGYSKIIPDTAHPKIEEARITKLERLYLLKDFYSTGLGRELFDFNVSLAKELGQKGMWLMVWVGNERAIRFYEKTGFSKIGETLFRLSERLSNPNYWMYKAL